MVYGLSLGQPMGLKSDEGQALLRPKAEAPSQEKPTPDVSIGSQGTDGMFCSTAGVGVRGGQRKQGQQGGRAGSQYMSIKSCIKVYRETAPQLSLGLEPASWAWC